MKAATNEPPAKLASQTTGLKMILAQSSGTKRPLATT